MIWDFEEGDIYSGFLSRHPVILRFFSSFVGLIDYREIAFEGRKFLFCVVCYENAHYDGLSIHVATAEWRQLRNVWFRLKIIHVRHKHGLVPVT
jgi:hypothetical protein